MSDITTTIRDRIARHPVLLYMKGTPDRPLCGFSAGLVGALRHYGVPFHAIDVLADPAIRQAIKDFSSWPTIPQLYVDGSFIGGFDIVREMHEAGELAPLLARHAGDVEI